MRGTSQPGAVGLARESVPRKRRDHDFERVGRGPAVCSGVGQRTDHLQLLDDRTGPAVGDDDRQGVRVLRLHVDEVDVEPVDVRDEIGIGEDLRLGAAPIVTVRPMIGELLHCREPDALRVVVHRLPVGPLGRLDPALEVGEFLIRCTIFERTDRGVAALLSGRSDDRRISAGSGGGGRRRSRLADRRARAGRNRRGAHRRQGKKRSDRSDCGSGQEMAAADHEAWSVHARSPAL